MTSLKAGSYLLITPITSQTCHAKLKTQINRRRAYQLLSVGGMPTASSSAKDFSPKKSGRCGNSGQRAWRFTYDWSWWYPSGSSGAAISGLHCRALVMVSSRHKADGLIAASKKRAERSGDWCMSRVTAIISALVISSSSACHGLLIVVNAITYKAQRDKNAEERSWRTRQLLTHADASAWCCCARCKIHEGVSWC